MAAKRKPSPLAPAPQVTPPSAPKRALSTPGLPEASWEPIESLTPWAKNPRKITGRAIDKVARLITKFGWTNPIIVRLADRQIVAGHTRYRAAKQLGMDKVLVRFLDLTPKEARALAIADNRSGEENEWDEDLLADAIRDMRDGGEDLADLTFDEDEVDKILARAAVGDDDPHDDGMTGTPVPRDRDGDDAGDDELALDEVAAVAGSGFDTEVLKFRRIKIPVPEDMGDRFVALVQKFGKDRGTTVGFMEHMVECLEGA